VLVEQESSRETRRRLRERKTGPDGLDSKDAEGSTLPENTSNERPFMHVCVHRIPVSKAQPFHSTGARQDITMSASDMSLAGSKDCRLHSSVLIGDPAYNNECHSNSM
jgi:hypothetical protein